ncbi:hypothetical protein pb186bvf_017726 [Paramecium bursaria]
MKFKINYQINYKLFLQNFFNIYFLNYLSMLGQGQIVNHNETQVKSVYQIRYCDKKYEQEHLLIQEFRQNQSELMKNVDLQTDSLVEATRMLDQAIKLDNQVPKIYFDKGLSLNERKSQHDVIKIFQEAIDSNNTDANFFIQKGFYPTFLYLGLSFSNLQYYQLAVDMFDQAIQFDSSCPTSYFYKGRSLAQLNKHLEALNQYDLAIKLQPNQSQAYHFKGFQLIIIQVCHISAQKNIKKPQICRIMQQNQTHNMLRLIFTKVLKVFYFYRISFVNLKTQ